ncbi:hypothetical protein [Gordonia insulae]|uniref:hypothetical protein n=1 Tax=Gordonia insulae TaxID=2420509 RepID=UPI000F5BF513|nr:hypothetical protein [Gordonia insulae]
MSCDVMLSNGPGRRVVGDDVGGGVEQFLPKVSRRYQQVIVGDVRLVDVPGGVIGVHHGIVGGVQIPQE